MYESVSQGPQGGLSLRRAGRIFRRQWWVVIGCLLLATLGSLAYYATDQPTYTATAAVSVQLPDSSPSGASQQATSILFQNTLDPKTEVKSPVVEKAVAAAGGRGVLVTSVSSDQTTVYLSAKAASADAAAAAANAGAHAFLKVRAGDLTTASAQLQPSLRSLQAQIDSLAGQNTTKGGPKGASYQNLQSLSGQYDQEFTTQSTFQAAQTVLGVSSPATPSGATTTGKSRKVVLVAAVAGLLAGLGIALAREQVDDKVRSTAELNELVSSGVLAELPRSDGWRRSGGTIADNPHGEMAEAVRELRTSLRFLSVKRPVRTLLVTSAARGDGKSFVAANLAVAWAISGVRTVIVSSDLRQPTLEDIFRCDPSRRGLSEAIVDAALADHRHASGSIDVDSVLVPTGVDGLSLLPAGPKPPNPAELLGSAELGKLLVDLREYAEVVVLDSPPVMAVTDALVLTAQADGVLFVVSEGQTSRGAVQRSLRQLESGLAPVLGVVVNRSSRRDIHTPY